MFTIGLTIALQINIFPYVNISLFHLSHTLVWNKFFTANTPGFLYFIYMEIEKPRITLLSLQLKIIPCILGLIVLLETSIRSMYFTPYEDYIVPAFNLCSLPTHLCCRLKQWPGNRYSETPEKVFMWRSPFLWEGKKKFRGRNSQQLLGSLPSVWIHGRAEGLFWWKEPCRIDQTDGQVVPTRQDLERYLWDHCWSLGSRLNWTALGYLLRSKGLQKLCVQQLLLIAKLQRQWNETWT